VAVVLHGCPSLLLWALNFFCGGGKVFLEGVVHSQKALSNA